MHEQAIDFVREQVQQYGYDTAEAAVLDLGGRKTSSSQFYNGPQPYELFKAAYEYLIADITPGQDVDIVGDATNVPEFFATHPELSGHFDVVVCTEVLEHVERWWKILETAFVALKPDGCLIMTCAGPGRRPHPATTEDWDPPPGEWYRNVSHLDVRENLRLIGFRDVLTYQRGQDTQAVATK